LYNLENFAGRKADFSQTVSCFDKIDFKLLQQLGIHVIESGDDDDDDDNDDDGVGSDAQSHGLMRARLTALPNSEFSKAAEAVNGINKYKGLRRNSGK
jgi:hypothetical protein